AAYLAACFPSITRHVVGMGQRGNVGWKVAASPRVGWGRSAARTEIKAGGRKVGAVLPARAAAVDADIAAAPVPHRCRRDDRGFTRQRRWGRGGGSPRRAGDGIKRGER